MQSAVRGYPSDTIYSQAPKKTQKDEDEDDKAFKEKKKAEAAALAEAKAKGMHFCELLVILQWI